MRKIFAFLLAYFPVSLFSQDIVIKDGWKFKTGDEPQWSYANFNDSGWAQIEVGKPWELQGYPGYDGFAWYRLHVVIPSTIKEKSFLKEKIRFDLGKIDDGDDVFLNGSMLGRNAGRGGDIKKGPYDIPRSYTIPLNDRRIKWDADNVIAVRVYDHGGDGGMYEGNYGISVTDVTDYISIITNQPFEFGPSRKITKKIGLQSTTDQYDFTGKLGIAIVDPVSGTTVFKQTIGADFAKNRPFEYTFSANLPETKSWQVVYHFVEDRSGKDITVSEGIPYILTPPIGKEPRINGPKVYGARQGAPFLFRIAATGEKPLSYEAVGLPQGLQLDKKTGIISGSINAKGNTVAKLTVKNKSGVASRKLTIICGDNICLTPALGWNSWNCWGLSVNDEKVRTSARAMFEKLADHGWSYINIDDGWEKNRNQQGEILANEKFPDMKSLCDYVHSLGLKIGIYSSPGTLTCGGFTGSYQHEKQDVQTYAQWGIDYLKYDWCSYAQVAPEHPSVDDLKKPYLTMRDALKETNRDIVFSLCQYGMGEVWNWGPEVGGNSWRTTGDITDSWKSLSGIGFSQYKSAPKTLPGHFNDPDMLVVGKVGWGPSLHNTRLTPDEQYTHISLWSLLSAPLLIGCDMNQLDSFTLNLLENDEVLAIDQDPQAKPAKKIYDKNKIQVWTKELEDGAIAMGIFNMDDLANKQQLSLKELNLAGSVKLRDVWRQKNIGAFTNLSVQLPPHGVWLLKAVSSSLSQKTSK
ncbi:MAG: alpha-galactosidase [Bacteroidetes bacterium]|nr:MAG: alpha-galactosidase [Bacteroidota bacterium]